jgi:hypothetical protein
MRLGCQAFSGVIQGRARTANPEPGSTRNWRSAVPLGRLTAGAEDDAAWPPTAGHPGLTDGHETRLLWVIVVCVTCPEAKMANATRKPTRIPTADQAAPTTLRRRSRPEVLGSVDMKLLPYGAGGFTRAAIGWV